ncbi:MAG: CheR family methyltransferase [Spirochaetia bacterium]
MIDKEGPVFTEFLYIIEKYSGMIPPDSNYANILRAIEKRCKKLNCTAESYLQQVNNSKDEREVFLNAATINETYLFREEKHFRLVKDFIFPEIFRKTDHVKIWSASCSTGEEAVSLAILAEEYSGTRPSKNYTVYASDINTEVLDCFKKMEFSPNSFRNDGKAFHSFYQNRYFTESSPQVWTLSPEVQKHIIIFSLNIFDDPGNQIPNDIDLVFFRNTLLYMNMEKRPPLIKGIANKMVPGGYLFLASSEVPFVIDPELEVVEQDKIYYFRKKEPQAEKITLPKIQPPKKERRLRREPAKGKDRRKPFDISKVIEKANTLTEKTDFPKEVHESNLSAAVLYTSVIKQLNSGNSEKAEQELDRSKMLFPSNKVSYFLTGFIELNYGELHKAISSFRMAIACDRTFWPAWYYLGFAQREDNPDKAVLQFSECRKVIDQVPDDPQHNYGFLLESFNKQYFGDMCDKWISKLGE